MASISFFYPLVKWHEQGKGSGSYCLQSQEVMVGESCQYRIKQRKKGKGLFITEEPYPPFLQLLKTPLLLMCSVAAEHLSIFFSFFLALLRRSIAIFLFARRLSALLCHFFLERRQGRGGRPSPRWAAGGPRPNEMKGLP